MITNKPIDAANVGVRIQRVTSVTDGEAASSARKASKLDEPAAIVTLGKTGAEGPPTYGSNGILNQLKTENEQAISGTSAPEAGGLFGASATVRYDPREAMKKMAEQESRAATEDHLPTTAQSALARLSTEPVRTAKPVQE